MNTPTPMKNPCHLGIGSLNNPLLLAGCIAALLALAPSIVRAATTINAGATFTIDDSNTTKVGTTTTWNDTGTLTIQSGATLQTWPAQNNSVINNNAIVFTGTSGTITMLFNDNDTDFKMNGSSMTSTATGAQTLAIFTGNNGNGDRESVTFNAGISNATGGSTLGLNITFRTQTTQSSWVNLNAVNTFTGPITLVAGSGATGILTIGGTLTQFNGNTNGSGTLGGGNYPGAISLGASTILSYASSAAQTLSGVISGSGTLRTTGSGALTLSGLNTYSGNTTVNSGGTMTLGSTGGLKFVVSNTSSNKVTGGGSATMNGIFTLDTTAVTATSGSWNLVDTTTKSFGASFGLADFTGPVSNVFTRVNGGQTWTFDKSTGVLGLSSKAIVTSFGITGYAGVINQTTKTIALAVPYSQSLVTLAPTYTLTTGTCNQTSGSPPTPTFATSNPVTYTVTDGSVVNNYVVTVTKAAASSACDILTCDFPGLGTATISGTSINLIVPPSQSVNPLSPTFTLSPGATLNPISGTGRNFTTDQTYIVTAESGATKTYTVSVLSYQNWTYRASLFISTTPDGANIPTGLAETNFPLLVRLNSSNFNFSQAQSDGRDIRFATATGAALSYQIEQWDTAASTAAVWVKIPSISRNARQEIIMYWGKTGVASESNGANVFNAANGYVSVFHLNETVADELGTLSPTLVNGGPSVTTGLVGKGRTFTVGQGVNCGDNLTTLPSGNTAHSTQVWYRSNTSNFDIVDWAREEAGNKVQIRLSTPPSIYMDGNFSSVGGTSILTPGQWHHVVHTYSPPGSHRLYVDGQLDGSTEASMTITPPSIMRLGGWYSTYKFVGDMDEVRLSKVTRSANWIKMEFENQRAQQTLVGNLVQPGSAFAVTPSSLTLNEGTTVTLNAQAGGAQKVYWIEKKNGVDTVIATDQFALGVTAGRVTGNQTYVIQFKAIYASEIKTIDIPVTITEFLPDPVFTLSATTNLWDGRQTMTVTPVISNLAALQAAGVANLNYKWSVDGVAVAKTITAGTPTVPGMISLTRAQGSGPMTVTLALDNGGASVSNTKTITVQEPTSDAWVQRTPDANEKPVTKQFYARDPNTNNGTVFYRGTQAAPATEVYLKIYTTDTGADVLYATHRQNLIATAYSFAVPIAAGKTTYKVTYGTRTGGVDSAPLATVADLVCGDAYLIEGQSNALATDNAVSADTATSPWIRSYGSTRGWGYATNKDSQSELQLGVWGWIWAKRLLATYNMPICIINGAAGGTRIDQHQPNPAGHALPGSLYSIYATLYNRIVGGKLTHGIRAVLWHQGEQDQGSGGPDGDYDYKFYQQYFVDMSAAWKQDFPNIQKYYLFQIWPAACGDTSRNDQLREVQRTLPYLYSNMRSMSTLGIVPGSGCHYVLEGYQKFSDLISPLVEQDFYGLSPSAVFGAPNLKKAYFTTTARTEITLEFDQNIGLDAAAGRYYLDGLAGMVSTVSHSGKVVKLSLTSASSAKAITYLKGIGWDGIQANLLYGSNGIAALTFADVPIAALGPYETWASGTFANAFTDTAATSDPDGDGKINRDEFAFGLDPTTGSSVNPITQQLDKATGIFKYRRTKNSGLTYKVYYSTNLSSWTLDAAATQTPAAAVAGVETVTVTLAAATPLNGKLFVRVEATTTP